MANTTRNHQRRLRRSTRVAAAFVAIAAIAAGCSASTTKTKKKNVTVLKQAAKGPVPVYDIAAKDTTKQWDDGTDGRCDPATGRVRVPMRLAPPCVPVFTGDNGGAQGIGVTKDTIKVAYYVGKPDVSSEFLTKSVGAYDEPADIATTIKGYAATFAKVSELYGRKLELVPLIATGLGTDDGDTAFIDPGNRRRARGVPLQTGIHFIHQ